jgi:hypothetical protein
VLVMTQKYGRCRRTRCDYNRCLAQQWPCSQSMFASLACERALLGQSRLSGIRQNAPSLCTQCTLLGCIPGRVSIWRMLTSPGKRHIHLNRTLSRRSAQRTVQQQSCRPLQCAVQVTSRFLSWGILGGSTRPGTLLLLALRSLHACPNMSGSIRDRTGRCISWCSARSRYRTSVHDRQHDIQIAR